MLEKNTKLKAIDLNNIKTRLNNELKLRCGEGSVYGYQDYDNIANVNSLPFITQWTHTLGTNINTGVNTSITQNEKYILSSEYNNLESNINLWIKRDNPTEQQETFSDGVVSYTRPTNPATTSNTNCNAACTGLCSSACFS